MTRQAKVYIVANGREIGPMTRRWAETIFLPVLPGDAMVVLADKPRKVPLSSLTTQWHRIGLTVFDVATGAK